MKPALRSLRSHSDKRFTLRYRPPRRAHERVSPLTLDVVDLDGVEEHNAAGGYADGDSHGHILTLSDSNIGLHLAEHADPGEGL